MTPHLVYVITDLELGGVPLHVRRLALQMRSRGFRITVVSLSPAGPVGDWLRLDGFDVLTCDARSGRDVRVLPRLAEIFRSLKPDLVHSFLFHANVAARWAAVRAGLPMERVICEIQTVEVERRWHLWVDRFTFESCRFTIGNSPSVVEHLHREAGIPRENLRLIRGSIDPARFVDAEPIGRSALGLADADRIVLWVGRLDPVKGLAVLIDALGRIDRRLGARLVLVGGGPLRGALEVQAARSGVGDRVCFLGPRDDVPGLLKACDVFAFPSRTEGLPNALLEAMAAGCAIVTTDVPGCRDLIRHEDTGLVVPYGDTAGLAGAIASLLAQPSWARALGAAAARAAATEWPVDAMFEGYARAYAEVLEGR